MRHFLREKNQKFLPKKFQKNVLRFLRLRYSADFRRSRLVIRYFMKLFATILLTFRRVFSRRFRRKSRLLQWLVFFFRQFNAYVHFLCINPINAHLPTFTICT